MTELDVRFCFYDEAGYDRDADADSRILQATHARLWSKEVAPGDLLVWRPDTRSRSLSYEPPHGGPHWVSSDTIATTHSGYAGVRELHAALDDTERDTIERAFYTIGGFIVFPVHRQSLNQQRGTKHAIKDRFDLTLECIRRPSRRSSQPGTPGSRPGWRSTDQWSRGPDTSEPRDCRSRPTCTSSWWVPAHSVRPSAQLNLQTHVVLGGITP